MSRYSSRQTELILSARKTLESKTPLQSDCGALCNAACCHGDAGMWLFPGEDALYADLPGFSVISADGNEGYPFLLCSHAADACPRVSRPLSCRIFPLFPYVTRTPFGSYRIRAAVDPRAARICPLLSDESAPEIDPRFRLAVERVGRRLMRDREMRKYLIKTSDFLRDIAEVQGRLEK